MAMAAMIIVRSGLFSSSTMATSCFPVLWEMKRLALTMEISAESFQMPAR
jgi:hypothetical protein